MIPLKVRRHLQTKRPFAVRILVCFFALGLASAAYGQADRVSQLIDELRDSDSTVRRSAALELGKVKDPRAVEPFIVALKDTDSEVRWRAAHALGEAKDPRAVEPLIAALNDTDSQVRRSAVWALGQTKDPRAVDPLIAALNDTDSHVRENAALELGEIEDPRAVEALIAALKDTDSEVRQSAAYALGDTGDPRAVDPLIAALKDTSANVRKHAAEALGKIKDPRAVEPLRTVLKDSDFEVQRSAAEALGEIEGPPAVQASGAREPVNITSSKHYRAYLGPALPREQVAILKISHVMVTAVDGRAVSQNWDGSPRLTKKHVNGLIRPSKVVLADPPDTIELPPGGHAITFQFRVSTTDAGWKGLTVLSASPITKYISVETGKTYHAEEGWQEQKRPSGVRSVSGSNTPANADTSPRSPAQVVFSGVSTTATAGGAYKQTGYSYHAQIEWWVGITELEGK